MAHRQPIQLFSIVAPLRHQPIHQRDKAVIVGPFEQVRHLVNNDVFEAFGRLLARSVLKRMLRLAGLQLPHFVFICLTKTRRTLTPTIGSHLAIRLGTASLI